MRGCNCGGTGTVRVTIISPSGKPVTYSESCACTYGGRR